MLQEKWLALTKSEQDLLVMKFGLSRTGEDQVTEEELEKVKHLFVEEPKEIIIVEKEFTYEKELPKTIKKGKKFKK